MENLIKLIEALESGEFTQSIGWADAEQLRINEHGADMWNVAGVASEIYRRETGRGEWSYSEMFASYTFSLSVDVFEENYMLREVANYFGFDDVDPKISSSPIGINGIRLSEAQEMYSWTFATIAESLRRIYNYYKEQNSE